MDNAVALVQAYLRVNGYFTVSEFPVIELRRREGYQTATDLDILAFRFPGSGRLVPVHGRPPQADESHFAPDPELEPVTEICSVHGSSEAPDSPSPIYDPLPGNYVRDALDRGYRLGFVGSGDSHDGHPGLVQLAGGNGGLAALLSPELTREGVYRALKARR